MNLSDDEQFYQRHLDQHPLDAAARLLLACHFAERGDRYKAGYRWLAEHSVLPQDYTGTRTWDWNDGLHYDTLVGSIPHELFVQLKHGRLSPTQSYREYPTRIAAERDFCDVLRAADEPA